jgi:predicted phage-related endonuclease
MNRLGFIGGSDCVKIMQGHWLELWQIKTGLAEGEDLSNNLAVQLGTYTESFNIGWFEKQHNAHVKNQQLAFEKTIGGVPVKGTIDGMWNGAVLECKHTNAHNSMEDAVSYYMPQIQTYAHLAEADGIWMSIIFGNNKWESTYVSYDQDYFDSMWAVVSDFWGYVLRNEEPVGVDIPSIDTDSIALDNMVKRDASRDNHFISAAHDYLEHEESAKAFDRAKKDLKAMVAHDEREVYSNLLTIKRDKRGSLRITARK